MGTYKGEPVESNNLLGVLAPAYNEYCGEMDRTNCHMGCAESLTIQTHLDYHYLFLQAVPYNGRSVYCSSPVHLCLFYDTGK